MRDSWRPSRQTADADFLRYWAAVTCGGALLVSTFEALLLQRRRSFFTGGFLAVDYLTSPAEVVAFLVVSVLIDAALVGVIAGFMFWLLGRLRVRATAVAVAAILAGVGPLVTSDVISYELGGYVGDLFDLSVSLELAGGSVAELLATASSHLLLPVVLIVGAGGAAGGLVWLTNRYSKSDRPIPCSVRALVVPVCFALFGLVLTTVVIATSDSLENGLRRKPSGQVLAWAVDNLSDIDGDGFGMASEISDPDLFAASVFPYAVDLPGNGIDENGVGGDLPAGTTAYTEPPSSSEPWARRPDVVLVVLESFRADLVGARQNGRQITPVLDALSARGISARHAYSHNGYTAPSRYHLLSGNLAGAGDGRTLIDDFNANGYLVAYFSGQDESFGAADTRVGFERADVAYDARVDRDRRYSTFTTAGSLAVPFGVVLERVGEFLRDRGKTSEPLFLYVNFHDTHFPYSHNQIQTLTSAARLERRAIAPKERDALWATYANTAANVDRAVGELLDAVRTTRGTEPSVIVTADHGESLFDEGFLGHGYALNDVQTRIPLIVANLPIFVEEPFAQRELRGALGRALQVPPNVAAVPRMRDAPDKEVFQYLGSLNRPRQIAFLKNDGRTLYDFRTGRAKLRGGEWLRPVDLPAPDREEFLRLIHEWERMMLARRSASGNGR